MALEGCLTSRKGTSGDRFSLQQTCRWEYDDCAHINFSRLTDRVCDDSCYRVGFDRDLRKLLHLVATLFVRDAVREFGLDDSRRNGCQSDLVVFLPEPTGNRLHYIFRGAIYSGLGRDRMDDHSVAHCARCYAELVNDVCLIAIASALEKI